MKNVATGSVVCSEHLNNILEARAIGKEHQDYFINARFFKEKTSFWDSVKKLKFSSWGKPIVCKKNNETITLRTDVNLFSRFTTVRMYRHIDLQNVFSHELSAAPLALFYPNGDIKKTSKSKLLKEIEITEYSQLPSLGYQYASPTVIDFMATIQSTDFSKFE